MWCFIKTQALASVAQLVGESSHRPKGCRLDSQSGHIPKMWVPSPVWVVTVRQPIDVSLSHQSISSLSAPSPTSFLCENNEKMSSGEDKKNFFNSLQTKGIRKLKLKLCIIYPRKMETYVHKKPCT